MARRRLLFLAVLLGSFGAAAATRDNDDSCDIALLPAATVRFDEQENPAAHYPHCGTLGCAFFYGRLPVASRTHQASTRVFPQLGNHAASGWMFINFATQAWVVQSARSDGRSSVDMDAVAMGNGCSPVMDDSEHSFGSTIIGPPRNVNP